MSTEERESSVALVQHTPQQQGLTLFGTTDPEEVIEVASKTARALARVIEQRQLAVNLKGRQHVKAEGWTLLGSMLGVFPVLDEVEPVERDGKPVGFRATVSAKTRDGATVGRATAYCMRQEQNWRDRDEFALASMAQTRATAKCLRAPLGFVMQLAGYDPTPADEMPAPPKVEVPPARRAGQATRPTSTTPRKGHDWASFWAAARKRGADWFEEKDLTDVLEMLGTDREGVTREVLQDILKALAEGAEAAGDVAAAVMGEEVVDGVVTEASYD